MITHSGYVAIIGRPNVGKSTLLNQLLGEKISIISPKPQTTRWQILGIQTVADTQIVYIDTPGLHQEEKKAVNRYMNRVARSVMQDVDTIIFMVEANYWHKEDELVLQALQQTQHPVILAINKIDLVKPKSELLPMIDQLKNRYDFAQIVPIAASKGENVELLQQEVVKLMPTGPQLFPEDQLTDKNQRFLVAEIIREKVINATEQELPYATTVEIESFVPGEKITEIGAIIWVERAGQKVIVIGKKGERLKTIGIAARREIETLLQGKVFLRLWVKIKKNWTDDDKALRTLGYD